jgi:hypothetical protein
MANLIYRRLFTLPALKTDGMFSDNQIQELLVKKL